ncbi:MAG: hypothetical protein JRN06_03320 [Nitrososphaerota archaeon]|nr:hypothetical protein [Nitrososphaerota archaeon]MDG7023111.1 hypothetical protein [Nitrososphaerota archaeon]
MGEHEGVEGARRADSASLLFKGPTVVAALVCFVAAVFTAAAGVAIAFASNDLQGTLLVSLSSGDLPSQGLLDLVGAVMVGLGAGYVISGVLLWSEVHWVKGVYVGLIVSMVGMVASGLGTTLAPGMAAAGMIIDVLIVTLLATETWEARRGMK